MFIVPAAYRAAALAAATKVDAKAKREYFIIHADERLREYDDALRENEAWQAERMHTNRRTAAPPMPNVDLERIDPGPQHPLYDLPLPRPISYPIPTGDI